MPGRVGNADLYIGMVRKRKSLPRDSKGFEPIEAYLREVEEDLNKNSSEGESGEETDVEEEKRKEEEARELKRRERERRVRERKAREERERKAKEEREWKERERKAEEEMERERKAEEERERREEERGTGQRSGGAIDEVRLESESEREETRAGETMKLKKAGGKGSRRSLRQRGLPASDTESSATDSEENNVCGPGTSRTEVESEQLPAERGADGGGGGGEGGGVMKNSSMAQKEGTESTVSSETEVEGDREKEGEGGETRLGSGGEEASGDGRVDGATLYSPEVTPTSPTRDTMKLGPVRLTFSVSPSDDERRTRRSGDNVQTTTAQKQMTSQQTLTLPANEPVNPNPPEFPGRGSGTDGESEARTEASSRFLLSQNTTDMSFNPKKTSTQVRGGFKQGGVVKDRASAARRGRRTLTRYPDSEEEEEEEEEDPELMTLLEPSARVSRLVGLSQLGRQSSKKTTGARESNRGSERDTPDDEATATVRGDSRQTTVSKPKRKSTIRPPNTRPKTSAATSLKKTTKSSRKSVAFNPHTTNLGSPEELPPVAGRRGSSPESDGNGGGIYDYVPSDEEDYAHNKSRLYSPRKKKSILRKTTGSGKRRSPHKERRHSDGVEEEGEESRTGSSGEEMRLKVGGEGDESGSVRGDFQVSEISGVSSKAKGNTRKVSNKGKDLSSKVATDSNRVDQVSNDNVSSGSQWFVPDDLSLHAMISDKSPRSLQRLTRTGRKSQAVTTDDTYSVAGPQRRRKEKRKPRKLDSTAEDGGSERENESGSLSGGASSADEVGTSGTSRRQHKTKEATNARTASGGKNTGRKKSTKSKVTTPWQKKRATPPSNEVHTDEEGEGRTPASKKQRVSTVEEDEGMQSGDGLSLSSSEEGEPSRDLVRSLGGRRYRRYTVEYQNPKTPGVRRSKRTRIAPIQTWNNEEPEYERRRSGVTLKGVLVPVEEQERRRGKRKRASPLPVDDDPPPLVFTDNKGVKRKFDVLTHPTLCHKVNGQGQQASRTDDYTITKLRSSPRNSCGLLELSFLAEKERSSSSTHEVFFFVLKGRPRVHVGRQTYDLAVESHIRIPAGVTYAIKNTQRSLARLYFHCHQVR